LPKPSPILLVTLTFALHGFARQVDAALSLLLRAELAQSSPLALIVEILASRLGAVALAVACWAAAGLAFAWLLQRAAWPARVGLGAGMAWPLLLRPALTVVALVSVILHPGYPYAFTLPVALSQDLAVAQDLAALAAVLAVWSPRLTIPAPRATGIFFLAFLAYALLTPPRALRWEGHPGNEPKYLRQAVALGHGLTLNAENVSAPMEQLEPEPLAVGLLRGARTLARESGLMLRCLTTGPDCFARERITASRITRQTIGGKEGGVFYVLAPLPSALIAPTLRLDRAVNRARSGSQSAAAEGRVVISVLLMNALGAALVTVLFVLARAATGRAGLAAVVSLGFALLPPQLFYFFQFYPEMPGALVLALITYLLCFRQRWTFGTLASHGVLLALLPWLHQKFLPVFGVLAVTTVVLAARRGVGWKRMAVLLAPMALSLYLTALYNFAITGSPRPDALFLAWGPAGVTTARIGQGLLGELLDARYGLLPYVPIYLLGLAGLLAAGPLVRRLLPVVPGAVVYYLTIAAADNWAGAVCNLGRYVMPVLPLLVVLTAVTIDRVGRRRGALTVVLVLAGWSVLLAWALFADPLAANDSSLLLGKSAFADGNQYIPSLFIRSWSSAVPGTFLRVLAWNALGAALCLFLTRVQKGRGGDRPLRALGTLLCVLLAVAWPLERWPSQRTAPAFPNAVTTGEGVRVFLDGPVQVRGDHAVIGPGETELVVRSEGPLVMLDAVVGGSGTLRLPGMGVLSLRNTGAGIRLPVVPDLVLAGAGGERAHIGRCRVTVDGLMILRLGAFSGNPQGEANVDD
jgi:hypothetical protein